MKGYIGKTLLTALSIALALGFSACDGAETGGGSANAAKRPVEGKVIKGAVRGASVKVYTLNANRYRETVIGEGSTTHEGSFSLQADNTGGPLVLVVATGGDYADEATGQRVAIPSWWELSAVVPWPSDYTKVFLTPLTRMAAEQAFSRIVRGENPLAAQENARRSVADYFGLRGVDITKTEPADLTTRSGATMKRGNAEVEYGLVLAALSQMTAGEGLPPSQTLCLIQNIVDDLADGRIDDVGRNGSVLPNNLTATPSYLIAGLQGASNDFLRGPRNASGIQGADTPTYTQAQGTAVPDRPIQGGGDGGGGGGGGGVTCDTGCASEGACSSQGGVNCPAGPDPIDGSVQCNDGTSDSSVQYSCSGGGGGGLPAPKNVTTQPGNKSVSVSWDPVTGAVSYKIRCSSNGMQVASKSSVTNSATISPLACDGLTYVFWVTAVNSAGVEGAKSAEIADNPDTCN